MRPASPPEGQPALWSVSSCRFRRAAARFLAPPCRPAGFRAPPRCRQRYPQHPLAATTGGWGARPGPAAPTARRPSRESSPACAPGTPSRVARLQAWPPAAWRPSAPPVGRLRRATASAQDGGPATGPRRAYRVVRDRRSRRPPAFPPGAVQRPELQHLDVGLAEVELLRGFPHRIAAQEAQLEHPSITLGERGEQRVHPLDVFGILTGGGLLGHIVVELAGALRVILAPVVGQGRLGDPIQPAAQLGNRDIVAHAVDRLHEHLGGEILGVRAVTDSAVDVLINGCHMRLVGPCQVILAVGGVDVRQRDDLPGGSDGGAGCLVLTHPLPQLYTARGYVVATARNPGPVQRGANVGILE